MLSYNEQKCEQVITSHWLSSSGVPEIAVFSSTLNRDSTFL